MMQASKELRVTMRAQTRRAGPALQDHMMRILAGSAPMSKPIVSPAPLPTRAANGRSLPVVYPSQGVQIARGEPASTARRSRRLSGHGRDAQRGIAAVEFALVFPVVFLLVYGLITWALILLAQQTLTLAVGEGARAALRYSTSPVTAACSAVNNATTWLGNTACVASTPTATACPYLSTQSCLKVTASYNYASNPLVPTLPFLNLVLPATLTASTTVQLEPDAIIQ